MTEPFETKPEDPAYVQMGGTLLGKITGPFNRWLVDVFMEDVAPKDVVQAVSMSFAVLMQLIANHTARPGHEDAVIVAMLEGIRKIAIPDVSPPAEKPNDSHN